MPSHILKSRNIMLFLMTYLNHFSVVNGMHFCLKDPLSKDLWVRSISYFLHCCRSFCNSKGIFYLISFNNSLLEPKSLAKECKPMKLNGFLARLSVIGQVIEDSSVVKMITA